MYTRVASNVAVVSGTPGYSQAVSMADANALQLDLTLIAKGGGDLGVQVEGSNELENWDAIGSSVDLTAIGYNQTADATKFTGIAHQYVRLKYTQSVSGTAIISAGINTTSL
jgi:hypothetical protein